jgi:hypothetical protein
LRETYFGAGAVVSAAGFLVVFFAAFLVLFLVVLVVVAGLSAGAGVVACANERAEPRTKANAIVSSFFMCISPLEKLSFYNFAVKSLLCRTLYVRVAEKKKRFLQPLFREFSGSYFGAAVGAGAGAAVSVELFLVFLLFLVFCLPLVVVSVLAGVWLLPAAGVWLLGVELPAWAKLNALPRASVHARMNNFFITVSLKGSYKSYLFETHAPETSCVSS